jgi:CHAD domain-containing protein
MKGIPVSAREDIRDAKSQRQSAGLDCQATFQRIAKRCVQLIRRNRNRAIAADPDAIHTMRIELTRLRAAMLFFSPMTNDPAGSPLGKELRWLNSTLGKARDVDVTMNYARRKRYRRWAKSSRHALFRSHGKSHRRLAKELNSARYGRLMAELDHSIANGSWLSEARSLRSEPADRFSRVRLREWRNEIWRDGRHLRALGRKRLHRLRIRCKRFRYMVAALQGLKIPVSPPEAAFCAAAKQVHGDLGDLRDLIRLRKAGQVVHRDTASASRDCFKRPKSRSGPVK